MMVVVDVRSFYSFAVILYKTRFELEWTIIFGLNCTKIYGGHMSSKDFGGGHLA